jgi:hypothetical protein
MPSLGGCGRWSGMHNESTPAPEPAATEADLLRLLVDLGEQRAADERHGGALWAEFSDWCWALEAPRSEESLELFAADRSVPLTAGQLERLRQLTAEDPS